jgi:hypothetical protein
MGRSEARDVGASAASLPAYNLNARASYDLRSDSGIVRPRPMVRIAAGARPPTDWPLLLMSSTTTCHVIYYNLSLM